MMIRKLAEAIVLVALLSLPEPLTTDAGEIDPVDVALALEVDLDFDDVTLDEALQTLSNKCDISIVPDRRELQHAGVNLDQISVNQRIAGIKMRRALDSILEPHDLEWIKRHDVLMITTEKAAKESYFETRVYKVTRKVPVDRRTRSITSNVARDSWAIVGGKGDASPLPPKFIVIFQSPLIHRDVAKTFRRSIVRVQGEQQTAPDEDAIDRKLNASVEIGFDAVPLAAVLKRLAEQHDLDFEIDQEAIREAGIQVDQLKVSLPACNVRRLASALSLLLERVSPELEWIINDQTVTITTKTAAEKMLVDRTYDVQKIVKVIDGQYLVEAVEYNIAADTWEFGGGDATIKLIDAGKLVVRQCDPVHRLLRQFLADLRSGQQSEDESP